MTKTPNPYCNPPPFMVFYPRSVKEVEDRGENVIATRVSQTLSPHFGGLRTRAHLLPSIVRGLSCPKMEVEDHAAYERDGAERRADGGKRGLELDRANNGGNYEPNNCRFISATRNQRNRRNTSLVVFRGVLMPLADAYETAKCPLPYDLVRNRVRRNKWPVERALTEPAKERA